MKKLYVLYPLLCLFLCACSGDGTNADADDVSELSLQATVSGSIGSVGEVDWYHYRAVEANNVLQVRCSSNTYRPDVELLVTAFERDAAGNMVRIYGDHALEESQLPADLEMNLYIDHPKDIYISVRDLMDDEASENSYYLTLDFAGGAEGDDNFTSATPLPVDDPTGLPEGNIGYIGDVDCYTFTAPAAGVYAVVVDFTPFSGGTAVELKIELYDQEGTLVQSSSGGQLSQYRLLPYLTAGSYYLLIEDYGRDDFDLASNYQVAVQSVAATETNSNDSPTEAFTLEFDAVQQAYPANGALDYAGDRDWYRIPLTDLTAGGLQVLDISFEDTSESTAFRYQLMLIDAEGEVLLSHDYLAGSSAYQNQVLAAEGDHYLAVQGAEGQLIAASTAYSVTVSVLDIDDPAEAGSGNDTIDSALPLATVSTPDSGWTSGKVAFRGDEDWYSLATDNVQPRVLEMFLETDEPSLVDYSVSILRDDLLEKVYDSNGSGGPTELKTSIYLPEAQPSGPVTYFYKVADTQGDDGDGLAPYWIRGNLVALPAALPADARVGAAVYYAETAEGLGSDFYPVRLEKDSMVQTEYQAETALLQYNGATPAPGISRSTANGLTTISFPWIGGYVDYQGDQDWFRLDLAPLYQAGLPLDTSWYYDIQVELYVAAAGSPVEYVWKLYRDANENGLLVDRPLDSNGFFASAGDPDTVIQPIEVVTPEAGSGQEFWVGDEWEGPFYLSLSDFEYIAAEHPDNDWGYDGAPYYVRLTLVYHPGVSYPE